MFRQHLETARQHGDDLCIAIDRALAAPYVEDVMQLGECALDIAWRMESAMGELLAVDDYQARVTGYLRAKESTRKGFVALREPLRDGEDAVRRSEAEIKRYLADLRARVEAALSCVHEALALVTEPALPPRPKAGTPPALVSIARDLKLARHQRGIRELIVRALEPLGGMSAFVRPGQTVLIKPNLTLFFLAQEGATTDPRVVASLVELAREAGAERVIVGESAGGGSKSIENMEVNGIAEAARNAGAVLVDFHTCEQVEVDIPNGKVLKRLLMPEPLVNADVVVNCPKAKTHHQDLISCALKNWVGTLRPDVRSAHHNWETYQEYLDILSRVPPTLNVVDAIFAGEGDGPGATDGRYCGAILASTDAVAADVAVARLLSLDPRLVTFPQIGAERGLGIADPDHIEFVGTPLEEARIEVRLPRLGVDYYPANVVVGMDVSRPGTLGHFKSAADIWLKIGAWLGIRLLRGQATILIGDAEDPLFEKHLKKGPYVVIDDAAPERYKHDPRVHFIPGHPCLHNMLPELLEGLGVRGPGEAAQSLMKLTRRTRSHLNLLLDHSTLD